MNILTFDIEDWFHIDFQDSTTRWDKYEGRLEKNIDYILSSLDKSGKRATFFCLGWIVKKYPSIIKEIDKIGYEIGSHTYDHKLLFEKTRSDFIADFERAIKCIEDTIGKKVRHFRAPAYSLTQKSLWVLEILAEHGIEYDSSIFPAKRDFGGFPEFFPSRPIMIEYNGIKIKEFPINIGKLFGIPTAFSGGGYFRLFPYWVIKKLAEKSDYMMVYLHPRDFDAKQPVLKKLSFKRKFKSYVGLRRCYCKFNQFLDDFEFLDITQASKKIHWRSSDVVSLA